MYSPATSGELVWDDPIVATHQMGAFRSLGDVFFPPAGLHQWSSDYYRPMVVLTYLLDQALFGRGASVGPHLAVVFYHAVNSLFVWLLARIVLRGRAGTEWGALAAGILFAVHPIHTESVSWITGRSDTVATLFCLPGLVAAIRWRDRGSAWALAASPLLFLLGALGKEVAVAGLLILPVLWFLPPAAKPPSPRRLGVLLGLHVLALAVYFGLRAGADVTYGRPAGHSTLESLLRAGGALAYYVQKVVVPSPQSIFPTNLPGTLQIVLAALAVSGLGALALRRHRAGSPALLVSLAFFFLALGPSLVIAVRAISETPVAERYLYLPSVGWALGLGWVATLGAAVPRWRAPVVAGIVLAVLAYGAQTVRRGWVWQSNLTLWSDAVADSPEHSLPWQALGEAQLDAQDAAAAEVSFREAVSFATGGETTALAHNSLGRSLVELGRLDEGAAEFRVSVAEWSSYASPHVNLGLVALIREHVRSTRTGARDPELLERAREHLARALRIDARSSAALLNLARTEIALGDVSLARGDRPGADRLYDSATERLDAIDSRSPEAGAAAKARALLLQKRRP